ncbi:MAG: tetratricopeptide repeat protein [Myxococcales bacterium]|nr:tetratricopeptide repeat protein [Myxococcales bacterium]
MNISRTIAWLLVPLGIPACAGNQELIRRVDVLEQNLSDLRRDQQRITQRLDELQIQLNVILKKLESARPSSSAPPASGPALEVVKLRPSEQTATRPPKELPLPRVLIPPVEPSEVEERLPVDREAARRPVLAKEEPKDTPPSTAGDERIVAAFREAFEAYRGGDFERAIPAMLSFAEKNPSHRLAPDAWYFAGKAELDLGRLESAEKKFDAVIDKYPRSSHAASAMLLKGRCSERRGNREVARGVYLQVVQNFPRSDEATEANRRLDALR